MRFNRVGIPAFLPSVTAAMRMPVQAESAGTAGSAGWGKRGAVIAALPRFDLGGVRGQESVHARKALDGLAPEYGMHHRLDQPAQRTRTGFYIVGVDQKRA